MDPLPPVVQRYLESYNSLDVDSMIATVTDDVVFENLSNTSPPTRTEGKAQFEALARQTVGVFKSRRQTVVDAVVANDRVALRISFEAVIAVDLPNGWRTGQLITLTGATFIELRGALIARLSDLS
ncbi:MAG: nuclear transport factor 2 family protein [Myxococcaceae bacterium]